MLQCYSRLLADTAEKLKPAAAAAVLPAQSSRVMDSASGEVSWVDAVAGAAGGRTWQQPQRTHMTQGWHLPPRRYVESNKTLGLLGRVFSELRNILHPDAPEIISCQLASLRRHLMPCSLQGGMAAEQHEGQGSGWARHLGMWYNSEPEII